MPNCIQMLFQPLYSHRPVCCQRTQLQANYTLARMLPTYSTPNQRSHDNHAQLYPDAISTPLFPPASMLPTYPTASQLHTGPYVANLQHSKPTKPWQPCPTASRCYFNPSIPTGQYVANVPNCKPTTHWPVCCQPTACQTNESHASHAQLYPDAISTPLFPPASMLPTYPTANQLHTGPYVANLQHSKPTKPWQPCPTVYRCYFNPSIPTGQYVANVPNCKPTTHWPVCCQPTACQTNESHASHAQLNANAINCNPSVPTGQYVANRLNCKPTKQGPVCCQPTILAIYSWSHRTGPCCMLPTYSIADLQAVPKTHAISVYSDQAGLCFLDP